MALDPYNRRLDYLRVSVTDRCNLRCVYCLPEEYSQFSPRQEALSDDEVLQLTGFLQIKAAGIDRNQGNLTEWMKPLDTQIIHWLGDHRPDLLKKMDITQQSRLWKKHEQKL